MRWPKARDVSPRPAWKPSPTAFIAVIITIMVLDLKPPQSAEPAALLKLWPSFAIYLFSFVFVAIYWINHHNLLVAARHVTASLIWANNLLLFCLSLIPFATAYVAETDIAPFPTMVYGALQLACALAFHLLVSAIAAQRRGRKRIHGRLPAAAGAGRRQSWRLRRRDCARRFQSDRRPGPIRPRRAGLPRARPGRGNGSAPQGTSQRLRQKGRPAEAGCPDWTARRQCAAAPSAPSPV